MIQLLPAAIQTRAAGHAVGWTDDYDGNTDAYFFFWLFNATRRGSPSVTLGFYAVNRRTATVWDLASGDPISTPDLAAVQTVIRRAHGITKSVMAKYDDAKLDKAAPASKTK